jgi:hypothetical protein
MTGPTLHSVARLKNAYRGERAAVIMGGTSLVAGQFDLARLGARGFVTFLESKALTPGFLASGLVPDYYLMLSPDKCLNNAFHNWVFRAFVAGFRLDRLVKPDFLPVVHDMRRRFDELFVAGAPERGPHKRYRWRRGVHLPDSPVELLESLPTTRILAERTLLDRFCPSPRWRNQGYVYEQQGPAEPFDRTRYYDVREQDDQVHLRNSSLQNSAAIALYPLLHYMGFRTVYFVGMDMSMLGSMEYGAPYTFKSMLHFRWYFRRTRHVFNQDYRPNRPWYLRPASEFDALKQVLDPDRIDLVRVFSPYRYTVPIDFMHSIPESALWSQ